LRDELVGDLAGGVPDPGSRPEVGVVRQPCAGPGHLTANVLFALFRSDDPSDSHPRWRGLAGEISEMLTGIYFICTLQQNNDLLEAFDGTVSSPTGRRSVWGWTAATRACRRPGPLGSRSCRHGERPTLGRAGSRLRRVVADPRTRRGGLRRCRHPLHTPGGRRR
jgi:hypothetical protein